MKMKIASFDQVNALYHSGVNICKGCEFENYGSCADRCKANNFAVCNKQARLHATAIKKAISAK